MKPSINQNTPINNFISSIISEKNKQIKESILLGQIDFPNILFYDKNYFQPNKFQSNSHKIFLNNLQQQKQLLIVKEEKSNLLNKVKLTDKKILNINAKSLEISHHDNYSLPIIDKTRDPSPKKKIYQMNVKPIKSKIYITKSKVNNGEMENELEKNAKNFIRKINSSKGDYMFIKKQKQQRDYLRLKKEISKMEKKQKKRKENFLNNELRTENYNNYKKQHVKSVSSEKSNSSNKYRYYSSRKKAKNMFRNFSEKLLNFNSELYYNNNIPDLSDYKEYLLSNINNNFRYNNDGYENNYSDKKDFDLNYVINNSNISYLNKENINNSRLNLSEINKSLQENLSERKHLYYFNDLKYENEIEKNNNKYYQHLQTNN